ncbi:MAG: hypothetical protein CAPSK01_003293 [Candidatus Accumulibacter vicinus]|uniref:Uncharacterized protein n=1 Tax=Candidatus Accumulibacter vicinus TaxID=2954382 RepID=A0A084XXI3_9PROT|nr:MAG: hypothetical protein CAPSK01_003293 [Candidatus Accumulibacter vicinus]
MARQFSSASLYLLEQIGRRGEQMRATGPQLLFIRFKG